MRSLPLRAALAVGVLALPLAEPPGAWASPCPAGYSSPAGYAWGWYYPAPVYDYAAGPPRPVVSSGYSYTPSAGEARSYYYTPGSTEARTSPSTPASGETRSYYYVPAPAPGYGGTSSPRELPTSSSGAVDQSRIFDRWKPDPEDPFSHSGQ